MAYIAGGPFQMGDNLDSVTNAMPVHNVQVDAFFMDKTEVSKELWQSVQTWGNAHNYSIGGGSFSGEAHPVQTISWYDMVKWCNARSEKEGLTPCYYTNAAQTLVFKTGIKDVENTMVKWSASGYRLPTEAEWEKAARGGRTGQRYPWGDSISTANANYSGGGTKPVGSYPANDYGLYDMVGNVWEWCWDWYGASYYGMPESLSNPCGPVSGSCRMIRGGNWSWDSYWCRVALRDGQGLMGPDGADSMVGFRTVRR
jgi:formylglycine-generating enzyme required for sulfatase activity